jgi:hypothetical protein
LKQEDRRLTQSLIVHSRPIAVKLHASVPYGHVELTNLADGIFLETPDCVWSSPTGDVRWRPSA